jgi:D-alanyl-D-alanine carboxypeptidase (penicillin-binding protein 5/6)
VGSAQVWAGAVRAVPLAVRQPVSILMRRAARERMRVTLSYHEPLLPPVARGQELGKLTFHAPEVPALTIPVFAGAPVGKGTLWTELKARWALLLQSFESEPEPSLRVTN